MLPRIAAILFIIAVVASFAIPISVTDAFYARLMALVPKDEDRAARGFIDLLQQRRYDAILKAADPSIIGRDTEQGLRKASDAAQNVRSLTVIGYHVQVLTKKPIVNISYEGTLGQEWAAIAVTLKRHGSGYTLEGLWAQQLSEPLEKYYAFTLRGKTIAQYVALSVGAVFLALQLWTLFVAAWLPFIRSRWFWMLASLVGAPRIMMDWTSGAWEFQPISIGGPAIGFMTASQYSTWILTVYLPIGAITFWLLRKRLTTASDQSEPEVESTRDETPHLREEGS
jgi:hypothetical protein